MVNDSRNRILKIQNLKRDDNERNFKNILQIFRLLAFKSCNAQIL